MLLNLVDKLKLFSFEAFFDAIFILVCGTAMIMYMVNFDNERNLSAQKTNTARMNVICPSLLSIGRSSRDTLIVMKAEPLCNTFVMENLK
jgi:hypothetical protein